MDKITKLMDRYESKIPHKNSFLNKGAGANDSRQTYSIRDSSYLKNRESSFANIKLRGKDDTISDLYSKRQSKNVQL